MAEFSPEMAAQILATMNAVEKTMAAVAAQAAKADEKLKRMGEDFTPLAGKAEDTKKAIHGMFDTFDTDFRDWQTAWASGENSIAQSQGSFLKYGENVKRTTNELGTTFEKHVRIELAGFKSVNEALEKAKANWKAYGEESKRHMTEARGALGVAGSATGLTSVLGGASNMISGLLGSLPFGVGGILGLILYGKKRKEEFDADAHRITRTFDQIGKGAAAAAAVRERVVNMYSAFGSKGEELGATMGALRTGGQGSDVFKQAGKTTGGQFGSDLVGTLTAFDAANKLSLGSAGKAFAEMAEIGVGSNEELVQSLYDLDSAAQRTGRSVESLMAGMLQGTSSLRVQQQGVGDLVTLYERLGHGLEGDAMKGSRPQAIAAASLRGIQAAAGGIGGLGEGLQGELARRMGAGIGVEGVVNMQFGKAGPKGGFAGSVFEQLAKLAGEVTGGGSKNERIFALEKIAPSLGNEGARAVIEAMGATNDKKALQGILDKLISPEEKMLNAFKSRSQEESAWEKLQRGLLVQLANIGGNTLTALVMGFSTLIEFARHPAQTATGSNAAANQASAEYQQAVDAIGENILNAGGIMGDEVPALDIFRKNALDKRRARDEGDRNASAKVAATADFSDPSLQGSGVDAREAGKYVRKYFEEHVPPDHGWGPGFEERITREALSQFAQDRSTSKRHIGTADFLSPDGAISRVRFFAEVPQASPRMEQK